MFKYFIEMRDLRRKKLKLETALVSKLYGFIDGMPDIVELAKKAQGMDMVEVQKMVVEELVKYVKTKDDVETDETGE